MFSIFSIISLLTITIPSSVSTSTAAACNIPQSCPDVGYIDFEQLLNTFTQTRSFTETGAEARDKKYCKKDPYHVFSLLTFLTSLVVVVITIVVNNNLNNNNNNNNNNKYVVKHKSA